MMQIQQGMQRLTNAAPSLLPGMGINTMGPGAGAPNRPAAAPPAAPNNAYNMQNLMSQVNSGLYYNFDTSIAFKNCKER